MSKKNNPSGHAIDCDEVVFDVKLDYVKDGDKRIVYRYNYYISVPAHVDDESGTDHLLFMVHEALSAYVGKKEVQV